MPAEWQPDLLFPCGDGKNRNEYFLIEYDDIIQSVVEMVFYGLLFLDDAENFPVLQAMSPVDPKEFFFKYSIYDPMDFLRLFVKDEIRESQDCDAYLFEVIQKALRIDTMACRTKTMMHFILQDLSHTQFAKKIYIVNYRRLEEFEIEYLYRALGVNWDKIEIYQSTVSDFLQAHSEITTVFMRDIDELLDILDDSEKHHLDGMLLVLRNSLSNVTFEADQNDPTKTHSVEMYNDEILAKTRGKNYAVARFYLRPFTDPMDSTMNLTDQYEFEDAYSRLHTDYE